MDNLNITPVDWTTPDWLMMYIIATSTRGIARIIFTERCTSRQMFRGSLLLCRLICRRADDG